MERLAFHQLHDDEGQRVRAVRDLGFPCIVDGDDVGVVEPGGGLGFAQQAGAALSAQISGRQHLYRDVTVQQGVVGTIDHAHTAPAEFGVEAVTPIEECADHFGHAVTPTVIRGQCLDYNSSCLYCITIYPLCKLVVSRLRYSAPSWSASSGICAEPANQVLGQNLYGLSQSGLRAMLDCAAKWVTFQGLCAVLGGEDVPVPLAGVCDQVAHWV